MTTRWSLGVLIGVPVTVLVVLILVGVGVAFVIAARREPPGAYSDRGMFYTLGTGSFVLVLVAVGLALSPVGFWPLKAEYHQWRPVSGTVQLVNSRIISDGNKSVNQRFVVQFAGDGRQYGCDDTRCSLLKPGDHVTLSCKREWQYAGVSGYGCNFVRDEAA